MKFRKLLSVISLLLLVIATLSMSRCNRSQDKASQPGSQSAEAQPVENGYTGRGLNRHPGHIRFSKHARCRMECRHIDVQEIREILQTGKINYRKSELNGDECRKKYALEGYSHANQHLRVIFAPCNDEMTVVTCIDLDVEWHCDCPGDHH